MITNTNVERGIVRRHPIRKRISQLIGVEGGDSWRNACVICILQATGKRPPGAEINGD
ncbi:hypothetical protein [Bacillus sp. SD088]|uniref:hypothetical protein n=1 Tax=Bacillus sp. SD088 TaxID=2782012 RepID=UPI001A959B29|nr:hypothetical protein [Bacillus sp. SD088]MBO0993563.1 hypothetical protein [Bacillus sp. SD088]